MAIFHVQHSAIGKSTHAAGTAGAHVEYITRESARTDQVERLPEGVSPDRESLARWINDEEVRDRANARVVDKLNVALPKELDPVQRHELVREYCEEVTKGRTPYVAVIHAQGKDEANPHAHLVIRDRDLETGKRVIHTSEKGSTERLREQWEERANRALERAGRPERIDHRSLAAQGIDREPTRHLGPNVLAMEERGIPTRKMDEHRAITAYNQAREGERAAVIDYQKAKAELGAERGVHERHQARMQTGGTWDEEGSRAVAQVERARGGPVEPGVVFREAEASRERVRTLSEQLKQLEQRQAALRESVQREQAAREEIGLLRQQIEQDNSVWHKVKEWWKDREARQGLKGAEGRARWRWEEYVNARQKYKAEAPERPKRLARLEAYLAKPLDGKSPEELNQEWRDNGKKTERLTQEREKTKAGRDLYEEAEKGYERHIQRDPEMQRRHLGRLKSGNWDLHDSRYRSRLELEAGGPVTREWLSAQAAKAPSEQARRSYQSGLEDMDKADQFKEYKRGRAQHLVERDPEKESGLRQIKDTIRTYADEGPEKDLARELTRVIIPTPERGGRSR